MSGSEIQPDAGMDRSDDSQDIDGESPACLSCFGEGFVDSVSGTSGRRGWDDDGPGTCPICNGTGLKKTSSSSRACARGGRLTSRCAEASPDRTETNDS
jgi:hypothetical protein